MKRVGKCKICDDIADLSCDHFFPQTTGNTQTHKVFNSEEIFNTTEGHKLEYIQIQGGYVLAITKHITCNMQNPRQYESQGISQRANILSKGYKAKTYKYC